MTGISSPSNKEEAPLLTVITVVYNAADELERTIENVLQQSAANFEYIIIDGGSKDGSVDVIKKYSQRISNWVSERDGGIYDAMNKGVRLASGQFVVFMNAGDLFYDPDSIKDIIEQIKAAGDPTIIYGDAQIISDKGRHIQNQHNRHLDLTKSIIHQSMILRRSMLLENPYNANYRIMADYDNLLSVSVQSPDKIHYVHRTICIYNKFGVSSRPLYTYFHEYYEVARKRMPFMKFVYFNFYIIPRLIFSFRHLLKSK